MWPDPQEIADLIIFTEEIPFGKLHFLRSGVWLLIFINLHRFYILTIEIATVKKNWRYKNFFYNIYATDLAGTI